MTIVINLYGSAGSGKSTTALGLTYFLKLQGFLVEYVSEYAKDLVNEGSIHKLKHQTYVFSKQLKRMDVLRDIGLDFIITDSPLYLASFYGEKYQTASKFLDGMVQEAYDTFSNINIFLERVVEYDSKLRVQNQEESDMDSKTLKEFLRDRIEILCTTNSLEQSTKDLVQELTKMYKK